MNKFIAVCIVLFASLWAAPAMAENKTLSWINATKNEDGTDFNAATEQQEIRIECIRSGTTTTQLYVSPGDLQSMVIDFFPGTWSCIGRTVATNGLISGPSGAAVFTVDPVAPRVPNPPSDLAVN